MTIGERIKSARNTSGLSMRELAEKAGVSAQAISKYERGINVPSSDVLIKLARALGKKVEYFFRPIEIKLSMPQYRKLKAMPKKSEVRLLGHIQDWLERYFELEELLPPERIPCFKIPQDLNTTINKLSDVERLAIDLRYAWELGLDPIENLIELLEDKGIKVGWVDGDAKFDACILLANNKFPVVVIKKDLPGDRQRFNLAHELGHLIMQVNPVLDEEKAAHRFAGAFLIPAPIVQYELGDKRRKINLFELHLLKHKYGLSMQAWVYRAKDLGIISPALATQIFKKFRANRWHIKEPGDQLPPEIPTRFKRLILQVLQEEIISEQRASELLGKPISKLWEEVAQDHNGFPANTGD